MIIQQILHTPTEKCVRTHLLLCDRWQTSAEACTGADPESLWG